MNKTFLLVAVILAYVSAVTLIINSFSMFAIYETFASMPGVTQQELEVIEQLEPFFQFLGIVMIVFGIANIFAAIRINAARNDKATAKEAMGWSIYLIFGSGLIGGIFGILGAKDSGQSTASVEPSASLETKLKEIDELFHKGLISNEEYQTRRAKLIDKV